jgi:hypothetical protein
VKGTSKGAALWIILGASLLLAACGGSSSQDSTGEQSNNGVDDSGVGEGGACGSDFDCSNGLFCIEGSCQDTGSECSEDEDCEGDMVCNVGYCVERQLECTQDEDCQDAQICDGENRCRAGCRADADCNEDLVCNLELLRCVTPAPECPEVCPEHQACDEDTGACRPDGTCSTDQDCSGELFCLSGLCGPAPTDCERNQDCLDGYFCNPDNSMCEVGCRQANECQANEICLAGTCTENIPDCEVDALEPNDSQETSSSLQAGVTLEGLTICDESDWFSFVAFEGDVVEVNTTFLNDDGNLNLRFLDPDGDLLQLLASNGDGEQLRRTISQTGTYWVEVLGSGRGVYNSYDIRLDVERNCQPDASEENDTAEDPSLLGETSNTLEARTICETDEDWYLVPLYPGETLEASISFVHVVGDLSLELYDEAGELLEASQTEEDQESLSLTAQVRRDVLLRVPGGEGLINLYDLSVEVTPAACEDAAEAEQSNDSAQEATEVASGSTVEGQICAGDEDWYQVWLPAEVAITATLTSTTQDGDLDLTLFEPDGVTIAATSATDQDQEQVALAIPEPGPWLLRVRGAGRAQNSYTLALEGGAEATCPEDDRLEAGEGFDAPVAVEPGGYGDLVLCGAPEEEDWFSVTLAEGQSLEAYALLGAPEGELDVTLFPPDAQDAQAEPFDQSVGGSVQRVRAQVGAAPGVWRVRVRSSQEGAVPYALRVNVYDGRLPLDCEFDDEFESNDLPREATRLSDRRSYEAVICGQDADWFRFEALEGEEVSVRLDFLQADGDVDAALFAGRDVENPVVEGDTASDGEVLRWRADRDGPFYVRVHLVGGEGGNVYNLTTSRIDGALELDCALDDDHEPNGGFEEASLGEAGPRQGILCGADTDWFAVPALPGQSVRAWLLYQGERAPSVTLRDGQGQELAAAMGDEGFEGLVLEHEVGAQEGVALRVALEPEVTEGEEGQEPVIEDISGEEVNYLLWWEVLDAPAEACQEGDALEPDDIPQLATVIDESGVVGEVALCGADEDWFQLEVPARLGMKVAASFEAEAGNLQMEMYDEEGHALAASYSDLGYEELILERSDRDRQVWVRTYLEDQPQAPALYALDVTYDENLGMCIDDGFEPNQNSRQATRISEGSLEGVFCQGGEDWYAVEVTGLFQTVRVELEFDPEAADLDLVVNGELEGQLGSSTGTDGLEIVVAEPFFPGLVFIRVYAANGGEASYELRTSIQ